MINLQEAGKKIWRNKGKLLTGAILVVGGVKGADIYNSTMTRINGLDEKVNQEDKLVQEDGKIIDKLTEQEVVQTKLDCVIVNNFVPQPYDCNAAEQQEIQYWQQVIQDIRGGGTGDINITPSQTQ